MEKLREAGVPCSPINNIEEVFKDEHCQHRESKKELKHPLAGTVPSIANPVHFSETPIKDYRASPMLGQHNELLDKLLKEAEE